MVKIMIDTDNGYDISCLSVIISYFDIVHVISINIHMMEYIYPLLYISIVCGISSLLDSKFGDDEGKNKEEENKSGISQLNGKEAELRDVEESIKNMSKEAERVNHPDTFVEYSKLKRQVLKLEKEREKLRVEVNKQKEELGGREEVNHLRVREKFKDMKQNATRNKLLVSLVLSFVFDTVTHFAFDADQLFPLSMFIGNQESNHLYSFRPSLVFAFFLVRFSNRLTDSFRFVFKRLSK